MKKAVIRISQANLELLLSGSPVVLRLDKTKEVESLEIRLGADAVLLQRLKSIMDLTRNPLGF